MQTRRFADADTARRFPLAVAGGAAWTRHPPEVRFVLELGEIGPGSLLVPSLALRWQEAAGLPPSYRWTLSSAQGRWPLPPVPGIPGAPAAPAERAASTHIDCFRIHRRLETAELTLEVTTAEPPPHYLISVSCRPFTVAAPPPPMAGAALAETPPPRSQMTAPADVAPRICSPTCVSMVLDLWGAEHDWLTLCDECRDPATNMYGVWPLAIRAAAGRGSLGAVEVFSDWREPLEVLRRGVPLVTSLRFGAGELPDAPLEETGGHLVVVHGVTPEHVDVCDPAAAAGEVLRRYPAEAFSRAWLRHRGAAYILPR